MAIFRQAVSQQKRRDSKAEECFFTCILPLWQSKPPQRLLQFSSLVRIPWPTIYVRCPPQPQAGKSISHHGQETDHKPTEREGVFLFFKNDGANKAKKHAFVEKKKKETEWARHGCFHAPLSVSMLVNQLRLYRLNQQKKHNIQKLIIHTFIAPYPTNGTQSGTRRSDSHRRLFSPSKPRAQYRARHTNAWCRLNRRQPLGACYSFVRSREHAPANAVEQAVLPSCPSCHQRGTLLVM